MADAKNHPVALVTGASAGLGMAIARCFVSKGYRVICVGRDMQRLQDARQQIVAQCLADQPRHPSNSQTLDKVVSSSTESLYLIAADVTDEQSVRELMGRVSVEIGRLDVLVNCVGKSDRGTSQSLGSDHLLDLMRWNVTSALLCSQAALSLLEASGGVIINIGSLASKVGARYMGGYSAAKHALAGLTQQMRLEWRDRGVHVALVSPGPIRRSDGGTRYDQTITSDDLPKHARQPAGGASMRGLDPDWVAEQVFRAARARTPDVILPRYARLMIGLGHLFPSLGDRLLLWMTRGR